MYIVQPRMSGNYALNDSLNATLKAIDAKIAAMANCKLMALTYDLGCDADLCLYDDLTTYKKLLLDKLLGCNCLEDQRLIKIISRIKKLLR
jgi:hypothetical protein